MKELAAPPAVLRTNSCYKVDYCAPPLFLSRIAIKAGRWYFTVSLTFWRLESRMKGLAVRLLQPRPQFDIASLKGGNIFNPGSAFILKFISCHENVQDYRLITMSKNFDWLTQRPHAWQKDTSMSDTHTQCTWWPCLDRKSCSHCS